MISIGISLWKWKSLRELQKYKLLPDEIFHVLIVNLGKGLKLDDINSLLPRFNIGNVRLWTLEFFRNLYLSQSSFLSSLYLPLNKICIFFCVN